VTPWVVQTRYDGIAWYVSARICAVGEMLEPARDRGTRVIEETYLSTLHSDGSENIVGVADAVQGR
jgi:hypothetical protein